MMEQKKNYAVDIVNLDEKLARIVLYPRDIDPETNYPKDSFISLRREEEGISFLRFDYMGEGAFRKSGRARETQYNKNQKKAKYKFVGWMEGSAGDILAVAPDMISFDINGGQGRPEHVNVVFKKDGDIVKGIVTDAQIIDVMDELFHTLKYVTI